MVSTNDITVLKFPKGSVISIKDPARYQMEVFTDPDSVVGLEQGSWVPATYEYRIESDNQLY